MKLHGKSFNLDGIFISYSGASFILDGSWFINRVCRRDMYVYFAVVFQITVQKETNFCMQKRKVSNWTVLKAENTGLQQFTSEQKN